MSVRIAEITCPYICSGKLVDLPMPFLSSLCIYSCLTLKFACLKSAFFEGGGRFVCFWFFVQMFAGEGSERSPPDQSDLIYFHIPQGKKAVHFEGNSDCD